MNQRENSLEITELGYTHLDKLVIRSHSQDDVETHGHSFFELVYVTKGTTLHELNGEIALLQPGDYFIVDFGSRHSYTNSKDFELINCLFLPEIIEDTLKGCRSFEVLMQRCLLRYYRFYSGLTLSNQTFHDEEGEVLRLLTGMQKEHMKKQIGYAEIFRFRLLEILILTMRKIVTAHTSTQNTLTRDMLQYIYKNYQNQKLLSTFCEQYHFSPQYVSRKFKQETKMTIMEYLQKVRLEKSCELLAGSDKPISEIAKEVGYEDVKFFNQIFRKLLQMTPRDYRKIASL